MSLGEKLFEIKANKIVFALEKLGIAPQPRMAVPNKLNRFNPLIIT